jgi:hypothetical protein
MVEAAMRIQEFATRLARAGTASSTAGSAPRLLQFTSHPLRA